MAVAVVALMAMFGLLQLEERSAAASFVSAEEDRQSVSTSTLPTIPPLIGDISRWDHWAHGAASRVHNDHNPNRRPPVFEEGIAELPWVPPAPTAEILVHYPPWHPGPDFPVQDYHLLLAAAQGNLSWVKMLCEDSKPNVETTDPHGQTPLHEAAIASHVLTVEYLVDVQNANLRARDKFGRTPLEIAASLSDGVVARAEESETIDFLMRRDFEHCANASYIHDLTPSPATVCNCIASNTSFFLVGSDGFWQLLRFWKKPWAECFVLLGGDVFFKDEANRPFADRVKDRSAQQYLMEEENNQVWQHAVTSWQTWFALAGAVLVATGLVRISHWLGGATSKVHLSCSQPPLAAENPYRSGARRMVLSTAVRHKAATKAWRVLEVVSAIPGVLGIGLLLFRWMYWLPLAGVAYGVPAVAQYGQVALLRSPVVALASGNSGPYVFTALVRLAAFLTVIYDPGIIRSLCPTMLNPRGEAVLAVVQSEWRRIPLFPSWGQDVFPSFSQTCYDSIEAQIVGYHCGYNLADLARGFNFLVFLSMLSYALCCLGYLVYRCCREESHPDEELRARISALKHQLLSLGVQPVEFEERSIEANVERLLALEKEEFETAMEPVVKPEVGFNCRNPFGSLYMQVLLLVLDMLLDLNTILTLLLSRDYLFAFSLAVVVFKSGLEQLWSGTHVRLREAVEASVERGIKHQDLLDILQEERGFEAFFSLCITSYSFWFSVRTPFQMLTQLSSIASSMWGLANFLYDNLDLEPDMETPLPSSGSDSEDEAKLAGLVQEEGEESDSS